MKLSARIGAIEFAGDEIRVAVVKAGGKLPRVLEAVIAKAVYAEQAERSEALAVAVREAVGQLKSRPAVFVLCAPSAWTVVRLLKIPFRRRSRVAAAVQFELEPYLAFPIEELLTDFVIVREVDKETETLVVGMRRPFVEEHLSILEQAGVGVEGVALDAIGLTSLWQARRKGASGMRAVLHVREEGAVIAILRGKRLAFIRHLALSSSQFHENPRSAAREVLNVLRAFSAKSQGPGVIETLCLTGSRFFEEERSLFEDEIKVPVQYASLVTGLPGASRVFGARSDARDRSEEAEQWAACIGTASAAAGGAYSFDFMPKEQAFASARRSLLAHAVFTGCLTLVVLAGLGAYGYVDYKRNVEEIDRVGQLVWEEFAATFPRSEAAKKRLAQDIGGIMSFRFMEEEAEAETEGGGQGSQAFSPDTYSRPTLLEILAELADKVPDAKASIRNLKMTVGRTVRLTISGEVKDPDAFVDVLGDLQGSSVFKVDLDKGFDRSSSGGKEIFVLQARS